MTLRRPIFTAVTIGFGLALTLPIAASAHANSITCIDQSSSTWRLVNDYPLAESFTSPQGPAGNVAAGNGSYTDVVYVGDSLQIDAVWTDGFTESRTGTGDCTPEGGTTTTTTVAETTTTTEATTSTTLPASTTTSTTTVPATTTTEPSSTSTTSSEPSTTVTTNPSTSSSVVSTSTTSEPPSTAPTSAPSTSPSTPPPAPSSTTPECSDNPNTPQNDCTPILPPTGFAGAVIGGIAGCLIGVGLLIGLVVRRRGGGS